MKYLFIKVIVSELRKSMKNVYAMNNTCARTMQ